MSALSVVIPTRDRPESLIRTLVSLADADESDTLEIVVVDDGSAEPIAPLLDDLLGRLNLVIHRQAPAGLNAARTAGLALTHASAIAFLDDDVLVDRGWPAGMRAAFEGEHRLAVAAGRTVADAEAPIPDWVSPGQLLFISVLDIGNDPGPMPAHTTPVGANLGVARDWIERAGGFRAGLDRVGQSLISGGETDLVRRIEALGGRIEYWPAATVRHRIAAERLTKDWFRRRALAQGVSDIRALQGGERPGLGLLAREAVRPLRAVGIAGKRILRREAMIDAELWLWASRGRWRELRRLRRGTET